MKDTKSGKRGMKYILPVVLFLFLTVLFFVFYIIIMLSNGFEELNGKFYYISKTGCKDKSILLLLEKETNFTDQSDLDPVSLLPEAERQFSSSKDVAEKDESFSNVTFIIDHIMMSKNKVPCKVEESDYPEKFMPIKKINGTSLYTGVFYKVSMKRFPNGWVTFTNMNNSEGDRFLEIDLDPGNLPDYAPGKQYQFDNEWLFGETEIPGWYTFKNRGLSKSFALASEEKKGSGFQLVIPTKEEVISNLSQSSVLIDDILWAPYASENSTNNYVLMSRKYPEAVNTWTYEKYGIFSHYLIAATKKIDMPFYKPNEKWYDDKLFNFLPKPTDLSLEARVFGFKYDDQLLDINCKSKVCENVIFYESHVDPNISLSGNSYTLENMVTRKNDFLYEFPEFPKMINNTKIAFNFINSLGCQEINVVDMNNDNRFVATQMQTIRVKAEIKTMNDLDPAVSLYSVWTNKLKIPFTSKMEIKGTVARMVTHSGGQVFSGPISAKLIKSFMPGVVDGFVEKGSSENTIMVTVRGLVTASFPITDNIKCESCVIGSSVFAESSFVSFPENVKII